MRLLIVNPNTTNSMTKKIGLAARAAASPGVEIIAVNPNSGPASIEGYYDEVFSVPGLIAEMGKVESVDATIIACFDDTGLEAARCLSDAPVIGIGEAGFHCAESHRRPVRRRDNSAEILGGHSAQPRQIRPRRPLLGRARGRCRGARTRGTEVEGLRQYLKRDPSRGCRGRRRSDCAWLRRHDELLAIFPGRPGFPSSMASAAPWRWRRAWFGSDCERRKSTLMQRRSKRNFLAISQNFRRHSSRQSIFETNRAAMPKLEGIFV